MAAACMALNVLLREKYLAYAVIIAISSGLLYLYTQGYNHWSYNPVLYGLWTQSDLTNEPTRLLMLRGYCLGLTIIFLLIAHVGFGRRTKGKTRAMRAHR